MEMNHPLLIGGSICVSCGDGHGKSFLGPVISGNEVVVNKTTSGARVDEGSGVDDFS